MGETSRNIVTVTAIEPLPDGAEFRTYEYADGDGNVATGSYRCSGGTCNTIEQRADGSLAIVTLAGNERIGETPTSPQELYDFFLGVQQGLFASFVERPE